MGYIVFRLSGYLDALHRYYSLRYPHFSFIDQFLYQFSTYGPQNKTKILNVESKGKERFCFCFFHQVELAVELRP